MKRKLAALLVMAMGVSLLAGCGGTSGSSAPAKEKADYTAEVDPMFKYDEEVTLTSFFEISPAIMDSFDQEEMLNSYYYTKMTEDTNIKIDYQWFSAQTADDSVQKKSVAIASGEIPDFMIVDSSQLALLAKTDLINRDIGKVFKQYASPTLWNWTTAEGDAALESASDKGDVIAIPLVDASIDGADMLWIRRDWIEKLNLEYPTTMDELYSVMKAFTESGLVSDNATGVVMNNDFLSAGLGDAVGIFNGFGAYPTAWIPDGNGGLVYGAVQEENKAALEYLAKLYAEGLIEQDFSSNDATKAMEAAVSGRAGLQYGAMWNANWPLNQTAMNDPEADWVAIPLPGVDGMAKPQIQLRVTGYVVVSNKCEHPEAIVRLLNFWVTAFAESGDEYNNYLIPDESGVLSFPLHWAMLKTWFPLKNLTNYWEINKALEAGNPDNLNAEQLVSYNDIMTYLDGVETGDHEKVIVGYGGMKTFGNDMSAFATMDQYYQNDMFLFDEFTTAPTKTMGTKLSTVTDKVKEYYTKVIMGLETTDSFDSFVAEVNALGLEQITAEVNEWYSSKQ